MCDLVQSLPTGSRNFLPSHPNIVRCCEHWALGGWEKKQSGPGCVEEVRLHERVTVSVVCVHCTCMCACMHVLGFWRRELLRRELPIFPRIWLQVDNVIWTDSIFQVQSFGANLILF